MILTSDEKGKIYALCMNQLIANREKEISDWDDESQILFDIKRKMGGL